MDHTRVSGSARPPEPSRATGSAAVASVRVPVTRPRGTVQIPTASRAPAPGVARATVPTPPRKARATASASIKSSAVAVPVKERPPAEVPTSPAPSLPPHRQTPRKKAHDLQPAPEPEKNPRSRRGKRRAEDARTRTAPHEEDTLPRKAVRGFGELLITCGLIILLFAAYEVYGKAWETAKDQARLNASLEDMWRQGPDAPRSSSSNPSGVSDGEALTRLHAPSLGMSWVVVEGTTLEDIRLAPGHYRDSALPGQVGNFAVAGHRTPQIFWDLDKMNNGDVLIVEDARNYYIYNVYKNHIVTPTDTWVVAPDPENPGGAPTRSLLTITTCHPKLSNEQRLIVHAELSRTHLKADGKPSELK